MMKSIAGTQIVERLESIIKKPIIQEPDSSAKDSKDISKAMERPRTPKEQLQAIIEFLEAHLVHSVQAVSRLAELTETAPQSIEWSGDKETQMPRFKAEDLKTDQSSLKLIQEHLNALKLAAGIHHLSN
jgi:hypothetical protein